jgi:hypothetical protein
MPTLHGIHKTNKLYTYDSLRQIIARMHPEVICVEMRSIDVSSDTSYLKKNYPYEMWMVRYWFPNAIIKGFDWLGEDLEGKPIPTGYWQHQSRIKQLERELNTDSSQGLKMYACQQYTQERFEILSSSKLSDILEGRDAELTREYYKCLKQQLSNTRYAELVSFYEKRDQQMQLNLEKIVRGYPGMKVLILTGDDHYPYLQEYLEAKGIVLLPPASSH